LKIPGMLSFLLYGDSQKPVTGLNEFAPEDRPPVNVVFQAYHIMVAIGFSIIAIVYIGVFFWMRGTLTEVKWYHTILVWVVFLPQLANQLGWIAAEVGRQPWIVYGYLRTKDALSQTVYAGDVWFSLILFSFIYALLFALFIFLLDKKIKEGPDVYDESNAMYGQQKTIFHKAGN